MCIRDRPCGWPEALLPVSYTHLDVYKRQSSHAMNIHSSKRILWHAFSSTTITPITLTSLSGDVRWKTFRIFRRGRTQNQPPEDHLPGAFFFGPDTRITLAYNNKRRLEKRINHRC
ncbi:hypothetical protein [Erwinia amylovora]